MKRVFQIEPVNLAGLIQPVLLMRAGERHFAAAIADQATSQLHQLVYYYEEEGLTAEQVREILEQEGMAGLPFYKVKCGYDFPGQSLLSMAGYRQDEAGHWKQAGMLLITEQLPEWQLYNIYPVPAELHSVLNARFPSIEFRNQFSAGLKQLDAARSGGTIQLDIRHADFALWAARDGKLLLSHSSEYQVPDDIIYYLLRICRQFELSQEEVLLEISGLIDRDSALYKELYQYFLQIRFREPSWKHAGTDYPAHFFTSLNDINQCVS